MALLVKSYPADSSFLIDIPFGQQQTPAVLYVPRSGTGAFYTQAMGFLMGAIMKLSGGKAPPGEVQRLLRAKLEKQN